MDEKTLNTLEFPKVIEKLAGYAAFSASSDLARALKPAPTLKEAAERLALTSEACLLLSLKSDLSVGGAHDIRPLTNLARRGGVLTEAELISVVGTLIASRSLARNFEKLTSRAPHLAELVRLLPPPAGIIEAILRCISDRGEVLDNASQKLGSIRSEIKVSHDRLMTKLERMITDPHSQTMLQEPIITQRNGRYVIPLRAEFKGKVKSIIHDQSASGATLFVEPLAVVELNNRWHELQLQERDEVRRILAELSDKVGVEAEAIDGIVTALAKIDFCIMCAKYAEDLHASEPILRPVSPPRDGSHPGTTLRLLKARHPLLDQEKVVPIDFDLDKTAFAVVITGPNTGGKTVTLKTVGLMVLMAQCGLHIPAQSGSELSFFDNVFADIGDEQSIEQSLSTFSGHITNIVRILERAKTKTLVLLDELGAGTDPQEGSALARAIMLYLVNRRIPCLIATHYPELKVLAHATPGVVNASMEFNLKTLRPTYQLTLGIPGRSNALLIAKRLNVPEEILDTAREMVNPAELKSDELLNEIHHQRDVAQKARSAADRDRSLANNLRAELTTRLERIEEERLAVIVKAREEVEEELREVKEELSRVRKTLAKSSPASVEVETLQPILEQAEIKIIRKSPRKKMTPVLETPLLELGRRVSVRTLKMEGILTALNGDDAEVQVGSLRVRAKTSDLAAPTAQAESTAQPATETSSQKSVKSIFHPSPGMELDLRGMRAEDALEKLDKYLDDAVLSGMPFVRIIHGKGTGRLRQVIREELRNSTRVCSYEEGGEKEGGEGVTIAHLGSD